MGKRPVCDAARNEVIHQRGRDDNPERIGRRRGASAALRSLAALTAVAAILGGVAKANEESRFQAETWDGAAAQTTSGGPARRVILFIARGMTLENQIAASRARYGQDFALVMQRLPYRGVMSTWTRGTYERRASRLGMPPFDPGAVIPLIGYDPAEGGVEPRPLQIEGVREDYLFEDPGGKTPSDDAADAVAALVTGRKGAESPATPFGTAPATIATTLRRDSGASIGLVTTEPITRANAALVLGGERIATDAAAAEAVRAARLETLLAQGPLRLAARIGRDDANVVQLDGVAEADRPTKLLEARLRATARGERLVGVGAIEGDLPAATIAALEALDADSNGFTVMIEAGGVGRANARGDEAAMIAAILDLDAAVRAAVDLVNRPDDAMNWRNTLLIVASDRAVGRRTPTSDAPEPAGAPSNELVPIAAVGTGASLFRRVEGAFYPCTRILDNTQVFHVVMAAAWLPQPPAIAVLADAPGQGCAAQWRTKGR